MASTCGPRRPQERGASSPRRGGRGPELHRLCSDCNAFRGIQRLLLNLPCKALQAAPVDTPSRSSYSLKDEWGTRQGGYWLLTRWWRKRTKERTSTFRPFNTSLMFGADVGAKQRDPYNRSFPSHFSFIQHVFSDIPKPATSRLALRLLQGNHRLWDACR